MKIIEKFIKIDTPRTSLIFRRYDELLETIYYGVRVDDAEDYDILSSHKHKYSHSCVDDIIAANMTFSCYGMGCDRKFSLSLKNFDGGYANNFLFRRAQAAEKPEIPGLPSSYGARETLMLVYYDETYDIELRQYYSVFGDTDVIAVSTCLENKSPHDAFIRSMASCQLDTDGYGYEIFSYTGTWARERYCSRTLLNVGVFEQGTVRGSSSHAVNPFIMLKRPARMGGYYAFNLVYSGNHKECVESTAMHSTRITIGMGDCCLELPLRAGKAFHSPEAVMLFGENRQNISLQMHRFVNRHIIRPQFLKDRPVAVNIWEACRYDFDRSKIVRFAGRAAEIGAELLVIDDGWFGNRNDEKTSLGDWTDNVSKTGGLKTLAEELRKKGLQFGIWMEPEMISPESDLMRSHPEYVLQNPRRNPILMRNQYVLDLTRKEVQDYIYGCIERLMELCSPDYIKWDYNRVITDAYHSSDLAGDAYSLAYMKALYALFEKILRKYPNLLIESCAAGGGRFDLGMLCYTPQIWTSDMTDAVERVHIQEGTLTGYPQSAMSAHIASEICEKTGRRIRLRDRFALALEGVFGIEYDITRCGAAELSELKEYVSFYKEHRGLLLYGDYFLAESAENGEAAVRVVVSEDKEKAVAEIFKRKQIFDCEQNKYRLCGLEDEFVYKIQIYGMETQFTAQGKLLNSYGLELDKYFPKDRSGVYSNEINTLVLLLKRVQGQNSEGNYF